MNNINNKLTNNMAYLKEEGRQADAQVRAVSNKMVNKLRAFHDNHKVLFYIILVLIAVLMLVISIRLIKKKIKWDKENPVFYRTGMDASKGFAIPNDELHSMPQSNSSSMFFWVNLDIVGNSSDSSSHSGFTGSETIMDHKGYITIKRLASVNNLQFKIPNAKAIIVKDFPMNRWFSIAVVIIDNDLEIYIDGKLIKTDYIGNGGKILLSGTDNSNIHIGPFKGEIASFSFSSTPYTPNSVRHFERKGPKTNSWLVKLFGYLSEMEIAQPKCNKPNKQASKSAHELKDFNKKWL